LRGFLHQVNAPERPCVAILIDPALSPDAAQC